MRRRSCLPARATRVRLRPAPPPGWLPALALLAAEATFAAGVPAGFVDQQVATGIVSPTSMATLPDGRVLVVQQDGVIRLLRNDVLAPANFYAVPNVDSFAERGCLGIAPDPDFASNHQLFLYCTLKEGGSSFNRVLRVTEADDAVVPGSERPIFTLPNVPAGVQWHMGGALRFGADGKLYIAVGGHEDTLQPVETSSSQNVASAFGKILRINADGSIPPDNPYLGTPGAFPANFAIGLRNPFSIDIQPGTGRLYINDVGAGAWEEIDEGRAGANYGWPAVEGAAGDGRFTNPVFAYSHSGGCAITGGAFYNPLSAQFPEPYIGKYFFADFCNGTIRVLDPAAPAAAAEFATGIGNPVNLGVAPDGSLYYLARNQDAGETNVAAGTVGKISFTNTQLPRIAAQPQSQTVFIGDPATFTVKADAATAIQWRRNGIDIPGATAASYTLPAIAPADDKAVFTAALTNEFGSTLTNPAVLNVTTNRFPVATISAPPAERGFVPGETIGYAGSGTDAEDGALPASALTWKIDFMHDTHSHPFQPATSGSSGGTLTMPSFEAEAANTWFRLSLTVKDSLGQASTTVRDLYPRTQLGELTPAGTAVNGVGPIEVNAHNGGAAAGDGGTLTLDRIPYAKGLGVHAPSDVRYDLAGACSGSFIADVGIDDSVGDQGSVVFRVLLDGVAVFDSGVVRGGDLRKSINVSVAGKNTLQLVVTDAGDGNAGDRADWAGARVTGCPLPAAPAATGGAALTLPATGNGGGGGGCAIGGSGRFDPVLPALLAVSVVAVAWRRRSPRATRATGKQ